MIHCRTLPLWQWVYLCILFFSVISVAGDFPVEFTCQLCAGVIKENPVKNNKCNHIFHNTCAGSLIELDQPCLLDEMKITNNTVVAPDLAEEIALYHKQGNDYVYGNAEKIRVARINKLQEAGGRPDKMVLLGKERMSGFMQTVTTCPHMLTYDEHAMAKQLEVPPAELLYTSLPHFCDVFSTALGLASAVPEKCIRPSLHIKKKGLTALLASYFDASDLYGYQLTHFTAHDGFFHQLEAEISALPAGNFFAVVAVLQDGTGRIALISKERLDETEPETEDKRERKLYLLLTGSASSTESAASEALPLKIYETSEITRLCEFIYSQVWLQLPKSILLLSKDHPGKPRIKQKQIIKKACIADFLPLPSQLPLAEVITCLLDSLNIRELKAESAIGLHNVLLQNKNVLASSGNTTLKTHLSGYDLPTVTQNSFKAPVLSDSSSVTGPEPELGFSYGAATPFDYCLYDFHDLSDNVRNHVRKILAAGSRGMLRITAYTEHQRCLKWIISFTDKQYSIALTERPELPVYTMESSRKLKILLQTLLEIQEVKKVNIDTFYKPQ